jgi:hypothetical protein
MQFPFKTSEQYATEDTVEAHLRKRVKALRGLCFKLHPFFFGNGIPDRLVLLPGGRVLFFELKRPKGGRFEPLQERCHAKLRRMGFVVHVCNTKNSVNEALENE